MSEYSIKSGIYKKDGKPTFAIGVSYYASYHERKVPVPPEGDRLGEALADIRDMSDFGFNIVRCAALGDVSYDGERRVVTDTPLLDAIARDCESCDIGLMLRLQGYSMNLSGYTDTLMVSHEGREMDKRIWYDFMRDCLFHEGLREDNDAGTRALAEHFVKFPSVVGWQTYNEPHYPSSGIYDYHPKTVAAYRAWLTERGYKTEEVARNFDPPRRRPSSGEDDTEWVRWRSFTHQAMQDFLCHSSEVAKGATGLETMSCITTGTTQTYHAVRGDDFFEIAKGMDALGITQYYLVRKPEAYLAAMNLTFAESAAASYGKPLWIVEYDAKTATPPHYFARNTYLALGTGLKGLLYYQWRGDHIYPDSPEGNGFGIINCDRTKTEKYGMARAIVRYINSRSELLVNAVKHRSGVGILRSLHGFLRADVKGNPEAVDFGTKNEWLDRELAFFTDCAKHGVLPDFTNAECLIENPLGIRLLFVPDIELISDDERAAIAAFESKGGKAVFTNRSDRSYARGYYEARELQRSQSLGYFDVPDVLLLHGICPEVSFLHSEESLFLQVLDTDEGMLAVITNIENIERECRAPVLAVPEWVRAAIYESFECPEGVPLRIEGGKIQLPKITDGALVRLLG